MATASYRSRQTAAQMKDEKKDGNEKENIWPSVLSEVQLKGTNKLSPNQQVVVIGDRESGKTTLVAKLQGNVAPKKGSGLEYAYIDVRDEYRDDHTHLAVWLLDGDANQAHLLRYALTEETYSSTLLMLTVSMTTPWAMLDLLDQLQEWTSLLQDHIDKLPFSAEAIREYQHKYVRRWQEYVEPGDELETAQLRRTSRHVDGEEEGMDHLFPLPEGVLTRNLGLDIVVVVTKTDYMATLEKDLDYKEEHFDFIQQHLRKFCLQYGAALFYTSVKEDKNCDLLYKYLVHRIYGLVFPTPALVVEKDDVFIHSCWMR
ncbi:LOW QUALITY PROTEIN: cytoplasmic dynein 1 light intermediate chain 2-like [Daphnia pulex]|uniref:LOW QUALITY PROTEIN: cytoplasmic dynein 1 light intermediate chain 2-like n=1 Tax=Daphnia pulex TaxID=6669 RepID=UPI001EDEDB36|nr:LOW QUALITY PROTEIN: cytoplasmic dynein 1 light intermediate chain 2-like [Daphnia pulex]XP_046458540.1 LOW QUALITY PROTEIN: cytoplasmic dynein 1 light intermediate chain 2-like [Daphnia pulex]